MMDGGGKQLQHRDREQWFVVHTKARKEEYARQHLSRRGITTFLPWVVHSLRFTAPGAPAPLFPGYLFVHVNLEVQYWNVAWAPGVRRLVSFGEPAALDESIIDFLRTRAGQDCIVRIIEEFCQGDRVRVSRGPLAGLVGIVEKPCSRQGRVRVLMELLQRQTAVEVPEELLDRVRD